MMWRQRMAEDKTKQPTDAFPGSQTGNRSGLGAGEPSRDGDTGRPEKKPTDPYPGSPTGNRSGAGGNENS